jgi:hypothetical protein
MISTTASDSSPALAACPTARPSEKLCSPIPTAIDIPTRSAASAGGWRRSVSAAAITPDRC